MYLSSEHFVVSNMITVVTAAPIGHLVKLINWFCYHRVAKCKLAYHLKEANHQTPQLK